MKIMKMQLTKIAISTNLFVPKSQKSKVKTTQQQTAKLQQQQLERRRRRRRRLQQQQQHQHQHQHKIHQRHQQQQQQQLRPPISQCSVPFAIIIIMLSACLPTPEARHVLHRSASVAADSEEYRQEHSDESSLDALLPTWHVNPFHGLNEPSEIDSDNGSDNYSIDDSSNSAAIESDETELAFAAAAAAFNELKTARYRSRQRRRRSHTWDHLFGKSEKETPPSWENPCGGVYEPVPEKIDMQQNRAPMRKHLILLRNFTRLEYRALRGNHEAIDLTDFEVWRHHAQHYKFLPKLGMKSSVNLKNWYKDMQIFIGSFELLGRAHYKYDKREAYQISDTTKELSDLLLSARRMLCEIESTINASYAQHVRSQHLHVMTRTDMQRELQFYTNAVVNDARFEVDSADLKYAKRRYIVYINHMWHVLQHCLKYGENHRNAAALASLEIKSTESKLINSQASASTESEERKRLRRAGRRHKKFVTAQQQPKQQHHHQQQQSY